MISNSKLIERAANAKGVRSTWESHWQEIVDHVNPRKNDILGRRTAGEKRGNTLFDSTAIVAAELLANHLHGILSNPAVTFFEVLTGDEELDARDRVRFWLQDTGQRLHNILNQSNFHTEIHEYYLDLVGIGTASLQIEEDDEDVVRFSARPIQEVCVCEDGRGQINEIYRTFFWKASQICEEFGEENVTPAIKRAKEKDLQEEYEILQAILPRDYNERRKKKGSQSYAYESRYLLVAEKHTLLEEGFPELPVIVSRWSKTSGEIYGRSPAMAALPDIKMINRMMEVTIMGAQLTIAPPFMLPNDGVRLPLKLKPFATNFYRSGLTEAKVEPLFATPPRVDFGFQVLDSLKNKIRQAFFVDQLINEKKAEMREVEVLQKQEEQNRLLGPMYGRQQFETLKPTIGRVYGIAARKGVLLPPPPELQGRALDIRYSSLIAKAQRSSEVQNAMRVLQTIAPIGQVDPSVWDNYNADAYAQYVARQLSLPQQLLNDERTKKDIRSARAEANKKMIDQQNQTQQAEVINKVAPHMIKAQEGA